MHLFHIVGIARRTPHINYSLLLLLRVHEKGKHSRACYQNWHIFSPPLAAIFAQALRYDPPRLNTDCSYVQMALKRCLINQLGTV